MASVTAGCQPQRSICRQAQRTVDSLAGDYQDNGFHGYIHGHYICQRDAAYRHGCASYRCFLLHILLHGQYRARCRCHRLRQQLRHHTRSWQMGAFVRDADRPSGDIHHLRPFRPRILAQIAIHITLLSGRCPRDFSLYYVEYKSIGLPLNQSSPLKL